MKAIRAVIAACIFVSGVSILQTCTKSTALHAQDSSPTTHEHLLVQGCVNIPPGQKRPEFGCFSLATESGLRFSEPAVHWHVRTFPNRAAADAAKSPTGIVVEEDGRVWLSEFGPRDLALKGGQAVAVVGPMELPKAELYAVVLGYAVMRPNDRSMVHVHLGPEGWYMISGEQCLETPAGAIRATAGGTATALKLTLPARVRGPESAYGFQNALLTSIGARSVFALLKCLGETEPFSDYHCRCNQTFLTTFRRKMGR